MKSQKTIILKTILLGPFSSVALATGASSFKTNSVIGSPALNRLGLHVKRVKLAQKMADARRRRLKRLVSKEHAEQFEELGFVKVENAMPDEAFRLLSEEVESTRFDAREMKQGNAVTRFITLSPGVLRQTPHLEKFVNGKLFQGVMRYCGSSNSDPLVTLHTVLTNPDNGPPDPQTKFHSDTFHSTSKGWMFLRDVEEFDGPFAYVPGSHRMTAGRLEWEYEQSLTAAQNPNDHHALGSFRASWDEIKAMGFGEFIAFPVPANTLVIADTHGFHARRPSKRASTRLAIYGSLRTNPFNPLAGPDFFDMPGLKNRKAQLLDFLRWGESKITGKPESQPLVGRLRPTDPAVR